LLTVEFNDGLRHDEFPILSSGWCGQTPPAELRTIQALALQ